jgi:hypothetical protein
MLLLGVVHIMLSIIQSISHIMDVMPVGLS